MMRHLVAVAPGHARPRPELAHVGGIGGDDAVIGIHHDPRLGQTFEERNQFARKWAVMSILSFVPQIAAIIGTTGLPF